MSPGRQSRPTRIIHIADIAYYIIHYGTRRARLCVCVCIAVLAGRTAETRVLVRGVTLTIAAERGLFEYFKALIKWSGRPLNRVCY